MTTVILTPSEPSCHSDFRANQTAPSRHYARIVSSISLVRHLSRNPACCRGIILPEAFGYAILDKRKPYGNLTK